MSYYCEYCHKKLSEKGNAIVDVNSGNVFCDRGYNRVRVSEGLDFENMGHAFQYILKTGRTVKTKRVKVRDISGLFKEN